MIKKNICFKKKSILQNILQFTTHIIGIPFTYKKKLQWYDKISQIGNKSKAENNDIFISNDQFSYLGKYIPKGAFQATEVSKFGDNHLSIMCGWKELLTKWYGYNYMELPPEEKRKPAHIISMDK